MPSATILDSPAAQLDRRRCLRDEDSGITLELLRNNSSLLMPFAEDGMQVVRVGCEEPISLRLTGLPCDADVRVDVLRPGGGETSQRVRPRNTEVTIEKCAWTVQISPFAAPVTVHVFRELEYDGRTARWENICTFTFGMRAGARVGDS